MGNGTRPDVREDIVDRLRCRYAIGPRMKNGEPKHGWRDLSGPMQVNLPIPVMLDAADEIERLRTELKTHKAPPDSKHITRLTAMLEQMDAAEARLQKTYGPAVKRSSRRAQILNANAIRHVLEYIKGTQS